MISDLYPSGRALEDPIFHLDGTDTWRSRLMFGPRVGNFAGRRPGVWRWGETRRRPRRNSDAGGSDKLVLDGHSAGSAYPG